MIWVAAHGRHPMLAPDESSILLSSSEQVPLQELAAAVVPSTGERRLLVLNICDSAAANAQGPCDDFGLAPSVAGPGQAVIRHLWPVPGARLSSSAHSWPASWPTAMASPRPSKQHCALSRTRGTTSRACSKAAASEPKSPKHYTTSAIRPFWTGAAPPSLSSRARGEPGRPPHGASFDSYRRDYQRAVASASAGPVEMRE